jgi:hypothetical protein
MAQSTASIVPVWKASTAYTCIPLLIFREGSLLACALTDTPPRKQRNVLGIPNGTACRAYGNKNIRDCKIDPSTPFTYPFNISDIYYTNYETPVATNVTIPGPV